MIKYCNHQQQYHMHKLFVQEWPIHLFYWHHEFWYKKVHNFLLIQAVLWISDLIDQADME